MKFLITCWPFEGHVFPQLAVAQALRERGHDVAFYTGTPAHAAIEAEGFGVFGFHRLDSSRFEQVQQRERDLDTRRKSVRVEHQAFRDWLVETIPDQVADLRSINASWQPDVVVTDLSMWGTSLVLWEADRIPVAASATFLGPMIPGPDAPAWGLGLPAPRTVRTRLASTVVNALTDLVAQGLRRRVDAIRADYGLGPLQMSVNEFQGRLPLYLVPSLPRLDYGRSDLPSTVHYTGPGVWHPPATDDESGWLADIPRDHPWVHVTEGTSHQQDPLVLKAAASGLANLPLRVIATCGANREPESLGLGTLAPNVHVTRWLSHTALLPHCSAVVTTGGPATIMAALSQGLPLVIVPTTWDKPDNARRVVQAGVGVRLLPGRCSPSRLRAAVAEILDDPEYARNARSVATELAAAPGPAFAAQLLEALFSQTRSHR